MTPLILGIETSTLSCSVALFEGTDLLHSAQALHEKYVHASELLPMIDLAFQKTKRNLNELDAVAVCAGPGSYTGLRIGVSTAKGICHARNIPLIAINSLEIQAYGCPLEVSSVVAIMDARRDEVYTQSFKRAGETWMPLDEIRAVILDDKRPLDVFFPEVSAENACIIGDAAEKSERLLADRADHWTFVSDHPQAKCMMQPALEAFEAQRFEDVAYFTPRYLKEFVAGPPKDPLGLRKSQIA